ncbi:MAG: UDP-3-O-(3-hydroxymyristoyl)glucosamine N-acyltransferase [Gammaproteobacteria bacterium]|nr:UDP-3-O-(3-hydroxymyristoyl)glucosamine N-acyltransferase [Gammaproteobacteria bacterium]
MVDQPTLAQLAEYLGARLALGAGASDALAPSGLNTLQDATDTELSFLSSPRYRRFLSSTRACAVLLTEEQLNACPVTALVVDNPYYAFARVSALYDRTPQQQPGIHPSAQVHSQAQVDSSACIGPGSVIEAGAFIDAGVVVGANCVVGAGTKIGAGSRLFPSVVLYHGCSLGSDCIVHSNVVIGADGFGFAPYQREWIKIHQLGGVEIGDGVEIGACSCIDRGALGNTIIGRGVKIDNQVQIAHNVVIGEHTAIAACAAVAGSATIGSHCTIAGGAGIVGHVEIVDFSHIAAMTLVTKSIHNAGSYASGTPFSESRLWRRNAVRYAQLDQMAKRVQNLEKQLAVLSAVKQNFDQSADE